MTTSKARRRRDKQPIRFLFDECGLGKPGMLALEQKLSAAFRLSRHAHTFVFEHIIDLFSRGIHDEDWVPRIARQGYIVITADRGKGRRGGRGEKLPLVCQRHAITHVMLNNELHHSNSQKKAEAIEAVFEQLLGLVREPKGSGYLLVSEGEGFALIPSDQKAKKRKKRRAP